MSIFEPTTKAFLDSMSKAGLKSPHEVPVAEAREALRVMQRAAEAPKPEVDFTDISVPAGSDAVSVRIARPKRVTGNLPVVIYLHGGGWVTGGADTHDRLIRELATASGAAVACVSYTLSPEAKYPRAVKDCFAVMMWLVENGASAGVDGSRIAVVGDSEGGNLAAAVTLLAKQRGGPMIARQVLFCPVTDSGFDTASYKEFATGPRVSAHAMKWFWSQYAPDVASRQQAMVSPLKASAEQLRGLPMALVITAECDVVRDEGEAYAKKLMDAGVEVIATRYAGTMHDFVVLDGLAKSAQTRAAIAQAGAFLCAGLFAA